jgi:DNA-binding NtrC family response regulator
MTEDFPGGVMDKPVNVLFLDDEVSILSGLERLLLNEPYGFVMTCDPDKAMELIKKHPVKVVVSDHRMPKILGVEFLRKVKEKYPDKIRILLSGSADFSSAEQAINLGEVYRFITKPWKTTYLKASILHGIEQYDLVQTNHILLETLNRKARELPLIVAALKTEVDVFADASAENQAEALAKVRGEVARLEHLINDILAQYPQGV